MNLVAVYGTLRKGHGNHYLIDKEPLSTERLYGWRMYGFGIPGCKRTDNPEESIVIEIYEVSDNMLANMDRLEGYREGTVSTFYDRVSVETSLGDTFIYEYVRECELESLVKDGDYNTYLGRSWKQW